MTSANVVEYQISKDGIVVGQHRENIMCRSHYEDLLKFEPLADHTIISFGYDEEEDYWEGETKNLESFLRKMNSKDVKEYFRVFDLTKNRQENIENIINE